MPKYTRSSRSRALNTVSVGPLTMARAVVSALVQHTRTTIRTAQQISSMVQSVELLDDRVAMSSTPEILPAGPIVCVPLGQENVALQSDFSVEKSDRAVLITLKLNAYLLDRAASTHLGPLVSRMAGHFNTQVRINLRETIDAEVVVPPVPLSRRLSQKTTP